MIKRSALKKYSKENGIKLGKKAEAYLLKNINNFIREILILSSKEATFDGRAVVSEEDIDIALKQFLKF